MSVMAFQITGNSTVEDCVQVSYKENIMKFASSAFCGGYTLIGGIYPHKRDRNAGSAFPLIA